LIREEVPYLDQDFLTNYVAANSDVHLICCDGVTVKATRLHLAALSPFMRQLLTRNEDGEPITIHTESHSEDITSLMLLLMSGCIVSQNSLLTHEIPEGLLQTLAEFGISLIEFKFNPEEAQKLRVPCDLLNALTSTSNENDIPEDPLGTYKPEDEEDKALTKRKARKRKKQVKSADTTDLEVKYQFDEIKQEVVEDEWLEEYNTGNNDFGNFDFLQDYQHDEDFKPEIQPKKRKKKKAKENYPSNTTLAALSGDASETKDQDKTSLKSTYNDIYYFPQKGEVDRTRSYQCTMCVRKFEGEIDFKVHVKRHNRENDSQIYFCIFCDKAVFELEEDFVKHRAECEDGSWAPHLKKYTKDYGGKDMIFHFPQRESEDLSHKYRCKHCIRMFHVNEHFQQHLRRHVSNQTPEEAYHCLYCNAQTFSNQSDMREHAKFCKINPEFHQPLPKKFVEIYEQHDILGKYSPKQRGEKSKGAQKKKKVISVCSVCGLTCMSKSNLSRHIRKMGPFHVPKCLSCDYRYLTWEDHLFHVGMVHGGAMLHGCGKCEAVFQTEEEKNSHRMSTHFPKIEKPKETITTIVETTQDKPQVEKKKTGEQIYCELCGKQLSKSHYAKHLSIMHGKGEITKACPECGKIFHSKNIYNEHMQTHFKKHICEVCGHACSSSNSLKQHVMSRHTPESQKPFYCKECDKGFVYKGKFRDHMNIHLKLRPHKCFFCDEHFTDGSNVRTHMRQRHTEEYEEYKKKKYSKL